jgi:hypothetical protein
LIPKPAVSAIANVIKKTFTLRSSSIFFPSKIINSIYPHLSV